MIMMGLAEDQFHKDSIWSMDVTKDFKYVYTGGKDGNIYEVDILNEKYRQILAGHKEVPIISLMIDEIDGRIWYGTPESDVHSIKI